MLAHHNESCHLEKMRKLLPLALCIVPFSFLLAEESVSNADLSRKLDLILGKVGGLEERVSQLEAENKEVKKEVKQAAKSAEEAKSATSNLSIPEDAKEKQSFFNKLKNEIYSQEAKDSGPWAKKESWNGLRKNLTRFQVRMALGDPHEVDQSIKPRVDQIYIYSGDLDADGKEEEGKVEFFRDRVVSFQHPF
jgi:vacuolar-type H+-ATPase subunit I/STV1